VFSHTQILIDTSISYSPALGKCTLPEMRTRVAKIAGVEFPICAPRFYRDLVVAVSDAGGLRILGAVAQSRTRPSP
jgi:hypothetical protein